MSVPEAVVQAVTAALPGAALYDPDTGFDMDDLIVFDGIVPPEPPHRYAVVYADIGTLNALAVCSISDSAMFRWQVTSVGRDALEARWIAAQIRDGIVDTRPDPDGWACGLVRHNFAATPARDEQVMERPVVYLVDQYQLLASRLVPEVVP